MTNNFDNIDISNYVKDQRDSNGKLTKHCGDKIAQAMSGLTLEQVKKFCSEVTGVTLELLNSKYKNTPPGPARMIMGNMIRATVKRVNKEDPGVGDKILEQVASRYQ